MLRKQLKRSEVVKFFANLPPCLIGMEACGSAHYWARKLTALGHEIRLMAPRFVKPYLKTNKNDRNDAEAICEAVARPNMRFVPVTVRAPSSRHCWPYAARARAGSRPEPRRPIRSGAYSASSASYCPRSSRGCATAYYPIIGSTPITPLRGNRNLASHRVFASGGPSQLLVRNSPPPGSADCSAPDDFAPDGNGSCIRPSRDATTPVR